MEKTSFENEDFERNIPKKEESFQTSDNTNLHYINGKPMTYKTGDVAEILGETPAMIRYYCREFEEFLEINHTPGEHRTYTEKEIKLLRYIIYLLKDKNLSVKQAKEFLSTPQGKLMAPIENDEDKVKVFVEIISAQLKEEISNIVRKEIAQSLREIQQPLLQLTSSIERNEKSNENITKMVVDMVEKTIEENTQVNEKLAEIDTISKKINQMNSSLSNVDQFISEYRQKLNQPAQSNEKKGFFSKFFGK